MSNAEHTPPDELAKRSGVGAVNLTVTEQALTDIARHLHAIYLELRVGPIPDALLLLAGAERDESGNFILPKSPEVSS